jgi:type I restriction enzyme S subunit
MSFRRYPKNHDSGVQWLGDVPEHWELRPLFGLVRERAESNKGMVEDNLLSLSYGRIIRKDIASNDGLLPQSFETYQVVRPGDIILRLTDLQNDKRSLRSALVEETGIITAAYLAVIPQGPIPNFLSYLLRAYDVTKVFYSMGGGLRQSMNFGDVKRMPTLVPPEKEQAQIVKFLDHETSKIDGLIREQRRFMELLREKRQAVISHAVTKGLNPDVPMKPSGVQWLGDLPAHWKVLAIKRFSTLQRGYDLTDEERTDGPHPVVTSGGINGTHGSFMARGPGVVTGRYGSTGRLFYVEQDFWPHNTSLYVCDYHGNYPRFVWYSLQTVDFAAHSAKAAVPGIDRNDIHVLPVAVPPDSEQAAIVEALDTETAALDALTAEAQRAIDLLHERRSALISAAVTGKIDVRGFDNAEAA